MSATHPVPVAAAVIERNGLYLICQRPAGKRHEGLWEFPGGKCDEGETLEAALIRELREELGLERVSVGPLIHAQGDPGAPYLVSFLSVTIEGDPRCLEHGALAWVRRDELDHYELSPSDRAFVAQLP